MDPLFRPVRRIMAVIPEADPRVVQPLLRVGRLEGTAHRHETSLQKMLGLFTGQVPIAPRHAISSLSRGPRRQVYLGSWRGARHCLALTFITSSSAITPFGQVRMAPPWHELPPGASGSTSFVMAWDGKA